MEITRTGQLLQVLRQIRNAFDNSTDPEMDAYLQDWWKYLTTKHADLLHNYHYLPVC